MLFFTDTNIALGYTVVHDRWHDPSKEFIENHEDALFWSNLVHDEYCRKLDWIIGQLHKIP